MYKFTSQSITYILHRGNVDKMAVTEINATFSRSPWNRFDANGPVKNYC